jgi:hypothetical protein
MISTLPSPPPPAPLRPVRSVLTLAEGVRLVSLDTVRAARAMRATELVALAQNHRSPDFLPAFDMSFAGEGGTGLGAGEGARGFGSGNSSNHPEPRRLVHFWVGALEDSGDWRSLLPPGAWLEHIVADCLLTSVAALANAEATVPSWQLVRAWGVSHQSIRRYIRAGQLQGALVSRTWRVNRLSAAEFLRRRVL